MKERGIIFNGEMVRAILDGRKTQTRRVMNNQPCTLSGETISVQQDDFNFRWAGDLHNDTSGWFPCPLGKVGDRLWVRETFKTGVCTESTIAYKATHKPSDLEEGWYEEIKWTPSIHMPRRYSRITLEITDVRVERLNDISNDDAKAEGILMMGDNFGNGPAYCDYTLADLHDTAEWFNRASDSFISLWQSIYGAESWLSNPWVWVIEFKRI
ncbi:hypothetical protein [Proteus terrae]|uniref:hypothetical protein n=1 Tax=Proteus terrae TaxID=1574161 RepID=UPI001CBD3453|nr:hypothetical protein [Proteus terrae]